MYIRPQHQQFILWSDSMQRLVIRFHVNGSTGLSGCIGLEIPSCWFCKFCNYKNVDGYKGSSYTAQVFFMPYLDSCNARQSCLHHSIYGYFQEVLLQQLRQLLIRPGVAFEHMERSRIMPNKSNKKTCWGIGQRRVDAVAQMVGKISTCTDTPC